MQKALIIVESLVLAAVLGLLLWERGQRRWKAWREARQAKRKKRSYTLQPRTPKDCLECRVEEHLAAPETTRTVPAWRDVKSPVVFRK